jgi:hypothetical protein
MSGRLRSRPHVYTIPRRASHHSDSVPSRRDFVKVLGGVAADAKTLRSR